MHPKTDIIVLVHNNLHVTKGFVKHLFNNTENFQLIFVDNGSTDEVKEFLKKGQEDSKWKLIRSETNLGVIGGRNTGAKEVASDYFVNLDNDQYVKHGWLDKLHNLMNVGNFDIVGCEAWRLNPPSKGGMTNINGVNINDRSYFPTHHCSKYGEKFTYIGCGGMLIKKSVYDDIGLFDPSYNPAYFEDPDLSIRAFQAGYKLGWCFDCPIVHLGHQTLSNNLSFDKNQQFIKSWNVFKKKWFPLNPPLHQTLFK